MAKNTPVHTNFIFLVFDYALLKIKSKQGLME